MTEFKGTPGPWYAEHADGPDNVYAKSSTGVWSKRKHDAAVENYEHRPMQEAWVCGIWGDIDDEDLANARLIAAAPELLESLMEVMAALRKEAPGTPFNNPRFDALGIKCYAAIAKALGEQK